jgi:glycosyltransferase involved in cell wall biosynthesis
LRVGLNLCYLVEQSGGAGTYARELLRALLEEEPETEVTAFVSAEVPDSFVEAAWPGRVDFVRFPCRVTTGPPANVPLLAAQWGALPLIAARRRLHVVHGLANVVPLAAPRVATVVTLLDLIWLHHPNTLGRRATLGMRAVAPPSARRADRVIAISHAAADDIVATLGLPREKIDVTHLGIRPRGERPKPAPEAGVRRELGLDDDHPVVLCIAQKREHKNLTGLLRAFAQLRHDRARLVLVGEPTPHEAGLRRLAGELEVDDRVRFTGWLPEERLAALYRLSACCVLPSFEEGFGLPILEAMAQDVPVACSTRSSLPEVAGDAALLFDPDRPQEIAAAIDRLLAEPQLRAALVRRGRVRCERFPWSATARATFASYRRAIAQRRMRTRTT